MIVNTDYRILNEIVTLYATFDKLAKDETVKEPEYPLDQEVRDLLTKITPNKDDDDFKIYRNLEDIRNLWQKLIRKSIICLRYFDTREPFQRCENKKPHAYGVGKLTDYFKEYGDFEEVLYGGAKYYRDHVMHVFRVWFLGIHQLLKNDCCYLKNVIIEKGCNVTFYEKLSVWTLIALTHDLGYPLEKSIQIVERTKSMMKSFVNNPMINMDVAFSGIQDSMNDYVLRFVSSKMWEIDPDKRVTIEDTSERRKEEDEILAGLDAAGRTNYLKSKRYVARLQPKYYFKFQKSLEKNQHGILSALIIYKTLLYFLESDYSINEDYMFDSEDTRQYYIRREILRAIASHTCPDIYQNDILRFSFLLILCDDAQDWGRKGIKELYIPKDHEYNFESIKLELNKEPYSCTFSDEHSVSDEDALRIVISAFKRQCVNYRNLFRDGLDTSSRNFSFNRKLDVKYNIADVLKYTLTLRVSADDQTKVIIGKNGDVFCSKEEWEKKTFNNDKMVPILYDEFKNTATLNINADYKEISIVLN